MADQEPMISIFERFLLRIVGANRILMKAAASYTAHGRVVINLPSRGITV
jgi:hypothetical protein